MITTTNPRTGATTEIEVEETPTAEVERLAHQAQEAVAALERLGREGRARLLEAIADALEADREDLVRTAGDETGLAEGRLNGELTRSAFQFRLFAEAVREGSYLEAMIDHAGRHPARPRPGPPADAAADRPGCRVRGQQLPVRVLGGRRATPPRRWPPGARC